MNCGTHSSILQVETIYHSFNEDLAIIKNDKYSFSADVSLNRKEIQVQRLQRGDRL